MTHSRSPVRDVLGLLALIDLDTLTAAELEQLERAFRRLAPIMRKRREALANARPASGVLAELHDGRGRD